MKRISFVLVCNLLMICFLMSCGHHGENHISLTVSENEHYYKIDADYDRNKTRAVEKYMDQYWKKEKHMSFLRTHIDARISFDDGTVMYMKKFPGKLKIKFDKQENSVSAYKEMKDFTEGFKDVIK